MKRDMFEFYNIPEEYAGLGRFGKLVWCVENEKNILTEGLITSYPFSSVLAMLNTKYGDLITHIQADPLTPSIKNDKISGISLYIKNTLFNENVLNSIKKDIDVYGYFVAFYQKYNISETGIFIEPKFPFIIDKKYLKNKKFFHITNIKLLNKIKKNGLTPRESQTTYNHPGNRIYLMASKNTDLINNFKLTLSKNKKWNINDIIILEINPKNLEFYIDPNFNNDNIKSDIAVFTFQNIPPDLIKVV